MDDKHDLDAETAEATPSKEVSVEKQDVDGDHSQASDEDVAVQEEEKGDASGEKTRENEATADSKAEEDEETDEDQPLGLLDQPLVVEGKRNRSSVQRLSTTLLSASPSPSKKTDYKGGKGVELSSIEFVLAQIDKHIAPEFKNMHRVLFGVPGKVTTLKRDIRKFNGFDFEKDSAEYKKRQAMLMRFTTVDLKFIKTVLGLTLHGDSKKETLVDAVMSFLLSPDDQHKKIPAKKRKAITSKKGTSPKKAKKSKVAPSKAEESDSGDDDEQSHDEDEQKPDSSLKSEVKRKATTSKKGTIPKKAKKSKPGESGSESAASGGGDEQFHDEDEQKPDSSLKAKSSKAVTPDYSIEKTIRGMLRELDLTEISLKEMVQMVFKEFPNDNLSERTDWVKTTIKTILKEQQ